MKKSEQPSLEQFDLSNQLADHPAVQWIYQNGKWIGFSVLGLVILLLAGYRLNNYSQSQAERDYIEAENTWSALSTSALPASEDQANEIRKLKQLMAKHKDLSSKYDALLAQYLIYSNNPDEALPLAEKAIKRTLKENNPYYSAYAQTSLAILQKHDERALTEAQSLEEKMRPLLGTSEAQREFGSVLYFYNLLRIASLQQRLGQSSEELATWDKAEDFLNQPSMWERNEKEVMLNNFAEGNSRLSDFIEHRRKQLSES